jgi:hypothetical protein
VIDAMRTLRVAPREYAMRILRLRDLTAGMLLDEALITRKGVCLVPAGQAVTPTLLLRLRGVDTGIEVKEPFRVKVPI